MSICIRLSWQKKFKYDLARRSWIRENCVLTVFSLTNLHPEAADGRSCLEISDVSETKFTIAWLEFSGIKKIVFLLLKYLITIISGWMRITFGKAIVN